MYLFICCLFLPSKLHNCIEDFVLLCVSEGTTKRKELHGTTFVHALSGTWAHKSDGVTLWAYKMNFVCNVAGENYSAFVLLVEAELDTDVASAEVKLHLVDKMVESSVSSCGQVHLNSDQVVSFAKYCEIGFILVFSSFSFEISKHPWLTSLFFLPGEESKIVSGIFL